MTPQQKKSFFRSTWISRVGNSRCFFYWKRKRSFHMNTPHTTLVLDLETKRALSAQSMHEPVFLGSRRVHVVGSMCEIAGLWPLLSTYPDPKGRYIYDLTERYLVGWDTVQRVLVGTRVFQFDQVEKEVRHSSWCPTEL